MKSIAHIGKHGDHSLQHVLELNNYKLYLSHSICIQWSTNRTPMAHVSQRFQTLQDSIHYQTLISEISGSDVYRTIYPTYTELKLRLSHAHWSKMSHSFNWDQFRLLLNSVFLIVIPIKKKIIICSWWIVKPNLMHFWYHYALMFALQTCRLVVLKL